jgi:uncharacterized protein YifE (UPF0438 family)
MYEDSKKLFLVEALLKEDNDDVLNEVEKILAKNMDREKGAKKFSALNSLLSPEEAEEFGNNIEKGCEQIDPDDWK